jgi:hypothetical protein
MEFNKKLNSGSARNTPGGQTSEVSTFGESCLEFQQKLLKIHAIYGKAELKSL